MRVCGNTAASTVPAGLLHIMLFLCGGRGGMDGVMAREVEDREGHSLLPDNSYNLNHESSRFCFFFKRNSWSCLSSCCSPHLNLSIIPLPHTNTRLYLGFQLLCNHRLYSAAHPTSLLTLHSNRFVVFFPPANLLFHSLCTPPWADPAGAVETKQAMHRWHDVHVEGWGSWWSWRGGCLCRTEGRRWRVHFTLVSKNTKMFLLHYRSTYS